MSTTHNIRQLKINKLTETQYEQAVKSADELYLTPDTGGGGSGTVTSVRVQAGTGLTSSQSTAQTETLNTTISIANGYKLPTTTEWSNKQDALPSQSGNSGKFLTTDGNSLSWATVSSGGGKFLVFTSIYVDAMDWTYDGTYADYPYAATITCQGVTSNDFAYVVFAPEDFDSGIYANVCLTGTDTVTIYGKADVYEPSYTGVTIPTIVVIGA